MADVLKGLPERIIQAAADEPAVYHCAADVAALEIRPQIRNGAARDG